MNKKLVLGATAVVLSVGLFTGCGNKETEKTSETSKKKNEKTLTCVRSEDDLTMKTIFVYDKDGEEVKEYIAEYSAEMDEDDVEDTLAEIEADCEDYLEDGYKGITCEVTRNKNKLTQTITIDLEKADADEMDELGFDFDELKSFDEMKEEGEDSGFTCK